MKIKKIGEGFLILLFWLSIWWGISLIANQLFVPTPLSTIKYLINLLKQESTAVILFSTLSRVMIGLLLSIVLGLVLGVLSGMYNIFYRILRPIITMIKSIPVVSFIILLYIYVNLDMLPSVLGILICFPIIYGNVLEGYRMVDPELIEMSQVYNVPRIKRIINLYIPSAIPYFTAGVLTSIGICWKATIAAEVIGLVNHSIGHELYNGKVWIEYELIFAWTFIIVICSLGIELITKYFLKRLKYYERLEK